MNTRYFTLDEASQLLPFLREILGHMATTKDQINRYQAHLKLLLAKSRGNGHNVLKEDTQQDQEEVKRLTRELRGMAEKITATGIILRDADNGLIDFPALRGGREVHLCWLLGEDKIAFWHEVEAGFPGRRPL